MHASIRRVYWWLIAPAVLLMLVFYIYHVIPMEALDEDGPAAILQRFRAILGARLVFVCFDMDVFDPSVAPGVFTPAWGGLTAREGLRLIRGLKGLNIVGFDVNTTTPTHDVQGLTAWLAATVVLEFCYLAAATLGVDGTGPLT